MIFSTPQAMNGMPAKPTFQTAAATEGLAVPLTLRVTLLIPAIALRSSGPTTAIV